MRMTTVVGIFMVGLLGTLLVRVVYTAVIDKKQFIPQASALRLSPPSSAMQGTIITSQGDIQKQGRDDTEFSIASAGAMLVQGDTLATGNRGQATVEFSTFAKLALGQMAEVALFDLDPAAFLLQQRSGMIAYTIISADHDVSVRALHTLVRLSQGLAHISVSPETARATVTIDSGSGALALIDTDNNTHVRDMVAGQTARIDDVLRTIVIR